MEWSCSLLDDRDRAVFERLGVFTGSLSAASAVGVVAGDDLEPWDVIDALSGLVAKSMVATRPIGAMMRYRLLDTTRAYALQLSTADAEFPDLAVRHAAYYRRWLEQHRAARRSG